MENNTQDLVPAQQWMKEDDIKRIQEYASKNPLASTMTLRDYFAAKAMQGDWAAKNWTVGDTTVFTARSAMYYRQADAMLKAREAK